MWSAHLAEARPDQTFSSCCLANSSVSSGLTARNQKFVLVAPHMDQKRNADWVSLTQGTLLHVLWLPNGNAQDLHPLLGNKKERITSPNNCFKFQRSRSPGHGLDATSLPQLGLAMVHMDVSVCGQQFVHHVVHHHPPTLCDPRGCFRTGSDTEDTPRRKSLGSPSPTRVPLSPYQLVHLREIKHCDLHQRGIGGIDEDALRDPADPECNGANSNAGVDKIRAFLAQLSRFVPHHSLSLHLRNLGSQSPDVAGELQHWHDLAALTGRWAASVVVRPWWPPGFLDEVVRFWDL